MIEYNTEMLRCIAVDDEAPALSIIRSHVERVPWIRLDAGLRSASAVFEYLEKNTTDIIFLDINMPDLSGLEIADRLNRNMKIIFTTAHSEYAIRGFDIAAVDYLLKPIGFDRFLTACERARSLVGTVPANQDKKPGYLFFKEGYNWIRINPDELIFLEASDNYVLFHEKQKKSIVRLTMNEAMARLGKKGFIRVHKSYAIAIDKIEKVASDYIMVGESKVPLSFAYKSPLVSALKSPDVS